ncbi:MAG: 50S ribosomal protein L6 [Patescibacteria group bacterium]
MSRIGIKPIEIPSGVTATISGQAVTVKGPKGELKLTIHPAISAKLTDNIVTVERSNDEKLSKSLHGLTRNLIANLVIGVTHGFEKRLEIVGVGYRANIQGKKLNLSLGFSHPVDMIIPDGITMETDKDNKGLFYIKGIDKQLVGQFSANVRGLRPPEPYKGKGIKYQGEHIVRKAGKAAASAK